MEVFTLVERGGLGEEEDGGAHSNHSPCCRQPFHLPFAIAFPLQTIVALGLTGLLVWNFVDLDAARNGLPVFGRLGVILSLLASFYFQNSIFTSHHEVDEEKLVVNLVVYVSSLVSGLSFWLLHMQYSSSVALSVVNYSSVEPVILTTAIVVAIYCLRRLMTHYDNARTEELDIYTGTPLLPQLLIAFSIAESLFGIAFALSMNLFVSHEWELSKRCACLVATFASAIINELAIMFSKESKSALLCKTGGFFVNLVCTQMTWWLSYYKERQLTLYGLGVGFLTLLFGVLYTVEMSLQTAQLNNHNPDSRSDRAAGFLSRARSGDSKKDNNEEQDQTSDTISDEESSGMRVLDRSCVIGFSLLLQIALCLLPVVVLTQDIFYPSPDPQKLSELRMGNWWMWALGFCASLLLNELILFQQRVRYWLVVLVNAAFSTNFISGCVLSYRANLWLVGALWLPYFILSHIHFARLTRFSLRLEGKQRSNHTHLALFLAAALETIIAILAFLPTTDFVYFPAKVFAILTFPSLAFVAEVVFHFGNGCRGAFLITFTTFFIGAAYSQLLWFFSLLLDEEGEWLGVGVGWLVGLGVLMGLLAIFYIFRFLHVILTKWEKTE